MFFSKGAVYSAVVSCVLSSWGDLASFVSPGSDLSFADYSFIGEVAEDQSGLSVSSAGDVDGDGLDDLLIGASLNSSYVYASGRTYLFLASSILNSGANTFSLSTADYIFSGDAYGEFCGLSVVGAGDVDGDGYDDLLIGAAGFDGIGIASGRAGLFLGSSILSSSSRSFLLSSADYLFEGDAAGDALGSCVASAGDVDGDGLDDVLIGGTGIDTGRAGAGKGYLFFGATLLGSASQSISPGAADYLFIGENAQDLAFNNIASGDVDGDGLSDLLIGANQNDDGGQDAGKVYLLLGVDVLANTARPINVSQASYTFIGEKADDEAGGSISMGEDVDGDGLSDLLIGAPNNDDGGDRAGKSYLFFADSILSSASSIIDLSLSDYSFIGEHSHADAGSEVSFIGDVDQDGLSEILIGSRRYDTRLRTGKCYLLTARSVLAAGSTTINLSQADYAMVGEGNSDQCGAMLAGAGDTNGDGISDILVGVGENDSNGQDAGKTYLILSDSDCDPEGIVYVDGYLGAAGALGDHMCPVSSIQEGIDLASSLSITQVIVRGWVYPEVITLAAGVTVVGESRQIGANVFYPYILNTNAQGYTVTGADDAGLRYCVVVASERTGGISLSGVDDMNVVGTIVYVPENGSISMWNNSTALLLQGGSRGNRFENNIFYSESDNPTQAVIRVGAGASNNEFINNTCHRLYSAYHVANGRSGRVVHLEENTSNNSFRNNIIYSSLAANAAATNATDYSQWYGFYADATANTSYTLEYNKTGANNYNVTLGTGCRAFAVSPLFYQSAPTGFDYRIGLNSTCWNAGDPAAIYNDVNGSRNNMGAYGGPNSLDVLP